MILAIDPGNIESAYVVLDKDLKPIRFGKEKNEKIMDIVRVEAQLNEHVAIEMIASYGMAVGKEVFDTCVWIGRFTERTLRSRDSLPEFIYRKDEKMNLCGSMKAKDSNIIQALIDRFAPNTRNKGKGIKSNPGWFYGFKKDIWQAYAVGVTLHDLYLKEGNQ
ncbi:hypothetical protein KQI86_19515 [Clostridium sp. MSJ-11]|uniref:RuvC-like resolvase n=1 Tax=Clostridium mobile TaxID=2841512 RepID=A0ABS6EN72_9CLOT|nr:hypothetical protein [Clostridium mobile]MBU5486493.1 hypothetical protein [Clostridium mobile]